MLAHDSYATAWTVSCYDEPKLVNRLHAVFKTAYIQRLELCEKWCAKI